MMDTVFQALFPVLEQHEGSEISSKRTIPLCLGAQWDKHKTMLDIPTLLLLNHELPAELRSQWTLLFSTRLHGESFSTLMNHICNKGPSVLIIKDKDGYVFGGFASKSWEMKPQFYGNSRCFLFILAPQVALYDTSSLNENYMYLNLNQQTLPNGLGMGGQFEYFGLWLSNEFGKGYSKAGPLCSTYNSPQLSSKTEFEIDVMEVWGTGHGVETEEYGEKPSILDSDPEATAILQMVGRGQHSEGLREHDSKNESPGDVALPSGM
ncbi:PREDICTED: TLD domain-containing protein 1-like [Priapulus caudatus]|uniref:MTOR-associated protein MEAK7 n=1 Tax=Priapulus caudatus TaxID=37621 RepID=A0ABM1DPU2_PRICU|nr:PREDICTED: TLD domain-containing protein 1-like [Priapulus caudatus]